MHVQAILQAKGSKVYSVPASARVSDVVSALNKHNIGAVVVMDGDGRISGIVSERDIVRLLGRDPAGALKRPISVTSKPFHTFIRGAAFRRFGL